MRFQTETVCLVIIIEPVSGRFAYQHLVGLLQILMRHKILSDGGRQRIVGQPFQLIGCLPVPESFQQHLQAEHIFHHRTQLRTPGRIISGDVLVAVEGSAGHSVILSGCPHPLPGISRKIHIVIKPGQHRRILETHGQIHDMGGMVIHHPVELLPLVPGKDILPVIIKIRAPHKGKIREQIRPVQRLPPDEIHQIQNFLRRFLFIIPPQTVQQIPGPGPAPLGQRTEWQLLFQITHIARKQPQHPGVPTDFLVLDQHLQHHKPGPVILPAGDRAEIAVLHGTFQRPLHKTQGNFIMLLISQVKRQRQKPVQIVGPSLPVFPGAAQPAGIASHAVPTLIQFPRHALHLNLQLPGQPALGPYIPHGQGSSVSPLKFSHTFASLTYLPPSPFRLPSRPAVHCFRSTA